MSNNANEVWLIEAAWGPDRPVYLSTTRGTGGYFFEWREEFECGLKFADYQSAEDVCMAVRELRRELFPTIVPYPKMVRYEVERDAAGPPSSAKLRNLRRVGVA